MASSCKKGYYFCNSSQKCKRIPRGHKVQSDGELVREYVSDWRSDLQEVTKEYIDKKQSQFKKDYGIESNPFNLPDIQKSNNEKLAKHKLGGKSFKMTGDGQNINFGEWGAAKVNEIGKKATSTIDKATNIATDSKHASRLKSHGTSADEIKKGADEVKSNIKKGASEAEFNVRRNINKHIPGTFSHQADKTEKEIAFNTSGSKKDANKNKGRFRIGVTNNEELQGGVSVEPYTKDTKFLEVETVDIIKPKALNASDWRSELVQIDEKYKYIGPGKGRKARDEDMTKHEGEKLGANYLIPQASINKKKETVSASYEADLENMIIEILEEDINDLHDNGFSYEEIAEFYDVKEELLNEGLVGGAIAGAKIIAKFAPKIAKFAAKRGIKDRKILTKFVKNPKNWQRANTDIQKVIDAPKNTYNLGRSFRQFADKGYKALKGGAQKLIEPLKKKGEGDIAKWKKTQEVIKRANRLAKSKAEKAGQIVDVAPTTTNLPSAKTSLPLPKKVTKGMTPAEIRHQGMNALAKLQGKTEKAKKAAELTKRMARAVEVSKKPGTYSRKVDDALKLSDPGSIVKSGSSAVTNTKPSGSGLLNRIKNLLIGSKPPKQITGSKPPKQITGSKPPKQITGSKPSKNQIPDPWDTKTTGTKPYSSKRELAKGWMAYNKAAQKTLNKDKAINIAKVVGAGAAGLLGVVAGSQVTKKKAIIAEPEKKKEKTSIDPTNLRGAVSGQPPQSPKLVPPPKENKTIKDTEKKTVDPKKNEVVTKTTTKKTSTTPKGRTKWVGANTTWVDRHGNVIAPKAKENKKYKYGRTGSHLTPLEQEKAN